jgi:hypothetical protein
VRSIVRRCMFVASAPEYNASMMGGNRGAWALRIPFEHLGAEPIVDRMQRVAQRIARYLIGGGEP